MAAATAAELVRALELAEDAFGSANLSPADYRLIRAERMLAGDVHCTGTACWRLTFKLARLIPADPSGRLGAGGEVFFTVDLDEERAMLAGYGE